MFKETTATKKILSLTKRLRIVAGGSSASKTISILIWLIGYAQTTKNELISVVSESFPHLKRGAMRDFINIMQQHEYWNETRWNKTDYIYEFNTGSKIEFFSADQPGKVRGPRRHILFINEANNIPYETFTQLEIRTSKIIWLDFNPVTEFWVYTDILGKIDCDFITLTYRDNEALESSIVETIESRRGNKAWFQVYGEGKLGEVEGRIYKGWQIIDDIPHEARLERYGLDFGYSCLVGETKITTVEGKKRIDEIQKGDLVLTRNGYKKVIDSWSNGIKDVYSVDFGLDKRIIITGDHRIYTKDGWKEVNNLSNKETICVLKQSSTEEFINDTQKENIQTTFTGRKKKVINLIREFCTGIFTKSNTEKFQKDIVSITSTKTHSTITQKTLSLSQIANTIKYILLIIWEELRRKKCKRYGQEYASQKKTGTIEGKNQSKQRKEKLRSVLNAVKKLSQQIRIKNSAVQFVEKNQIQGKVKGNTSVRNVEKASQRLHTTKETHVLMNVQISSQLLKEKREVFDLTVEGEREFFANGVLVHNCDPTAIVAVYSYNGGYIFDERLYRKGMQNKPIADFLNNQESALVKADCAEPKSISEIATYGVMIVGAEKGKDRVRHGIQYIQDQRISVTKRSLNLIREFRNYMWQQDTDGKFINVPQDFDNHLLDACRYALDEYIKAGLQVEKPKVGTGQYIFDSLLRQRELEGGDNYY